MFRRGVSTISLQDGGGLRLWPRPIMHCTALVWMMGLGVIRL